MSQVSPNTHTIIHACFMYAHLVHIARPGTFEEEVNKMFKLNNLPPIKTPNNPPSQDIMNVMSKEPGSNIMEAGNINMEHERSSRPRERTEEKDSNINNKRKVNGRNLNLDQMRRLEQIRQVKRQ